MENFFRPVHNPCPSDQIKQQRNQHHPEHHRHQYAHSPRYTTDDDDRNTDNSQGHRRRNWHNRHSRPDRYLYDNSRQDVQYPRLFLHGEESDKFYNNRTSVTLSRASSSSLSSSSSSFSSFTEASSNEPFLLRHAERPQHSLSCSNISDMRQALMEDESSEPIVFATIKHGKGGNVVCGARNDSRPEFSCLNRGHSRSEEGLQPGVKGDGGERSKESHMNFGPLYKTTSLNRSLAFSQDDIFLGVPSGPKRAVSSSQLPSKGILKNKTDRPDIRKAKSMEVISPRVTKGPTEGKGKIEQAQANFVKGKLQFSAFLDEITRQVMSPSHLSILGVSNDKTTGKTAASVPTSDPVKPQLPPKKHKVWKRNEQEQPVKQPNRSAKGYSSSRKDSDCSNPDKIISYGAKNHRGSPPPQHYAPSSTHGRKNRRPSPPGESMSGDRYGRCGPPHTDGTSTSPELTRPKQRNQHKHQQNTCHYTQPFAQKVHKDSGHRGPGVSSPPSAQNAGAGFGSESSSTKSDLSRCRETASTATSHSSGQSSRHQSHNTAIPTQHRDMLCDPDDFQALQEENADLHQNLLQTVVCIESLEAELQRTRDELSHVKEKYKSLLQTHSGTQQADNLLEEHLHVASESVSSERKFLLNRVSQLGSELEEAHRTITALENINVPRLLKELLEKHFGSAEAVQKFLITSFPVNQSSDPKPEEEEEVEEEHDWLNKSETGSQRVTAFMPVKASPPQNKNKPGRSGQLESTHFPSSSDSDASVYRTSFPAKPQPVYPTTQQQSSRASASTPLDPQQQARAGRWEGRGGLKVLLLEKDAEDVNSMSAQLILDGFIQHLQTHKESDGGKEQQGVNG
ncbi:uncharacterized protein LOC106515990 [Austrofundulus limnaeus]|uniref:Uncharacterized protein LOC106515990 n=1 Tax=Austrofundulus limnaeus TaxID=52670 RepID=A0A2I4B1D4_AUSLI|nr:PREDICTED: uncharacterized protein LOC106515990 [Austrofundulus limnaeus]